MLECDTGAECRSTILPNASAHEELIIPNNGDSFMIEWTLKSAGATV